MILVTGANGQLGQCFRKAAADEPTLNFLFWGASELDITDKEAVNTGFQNLVLGANEPLWVINCAAYTAVDKAEQEADNAFRINVLGVQNLANACARFKASLIHFSTDYVYHGEQNTPIRETDPVNPQGVYARTKYEGEQAALRLHPTQTMVIRTAWVYAPYGHNFVKTMLRLGRERDQLSVVFDQIGSPTYAPDLAEVVLQIIHKVESGEVPREKIVGIWHYSNEGVASWYDFAAAIFEINGFTCQLVPIRSEAYPTPAPRPSYSVLDKAKIKAVFGIEIPHWRTALSRATPLG